MPLHCSLTTPHICAFYSACLSPTVCSFLLALSATSAVCIQLVRHQTLLPLLRLLWLLQALRAHSLLARSTVCRPRCIDRVGAVATALLTVCRVAGLWVVLCCYFASLCCCVLLGVFRRSRYLSHPCHVARHPLLSEHIASAVSGVRSVAQSVAALRVVLVVLDTESSRCLERFVFDSRLHHYQRTDDTTHQQHQQHTHTVRADSAADLAALQRELAGCIAQLTHCNALLAPIPATARCSFTLLIATQHHQHQQQQQRGAVGADGSPCWLPLDLTAAAAAAWSPSSAAHDAERPLIVPIRSMRTALLDVEVYVECGSKPE